MATLQQIREKLDLYERLMRLDKPIGILLLLWPTLWALWLSADGRLRGAHDRILTMHPAVVDL